METRELSTAGFFTPDAGVAMELESHREPSSLTWLAIAAVAVGAAVLVQIGADSRWLAALGGHIATARTIPDGLPYAAVSSAGWKNAPVLGELVFHALYAALSDRGLVLAQIGAVVAAFVFIGRDMRAAGAGDASRAIMLVGTALAAAPALLVVRAQLFSLALFPLVVLILRSETRRPSRRIWLVVPLLAVWSNLHGAVLVGVVVSAVYLLLHRMRQEPAVALGVLVASVAALLATPALLGTASYYHSVLTSEAAVRGFGLWAPLSVHAFFDVMFLVAAIPLCVAVLRVRPVVWELAVLVGLAAMAVHANRNTVWFALFAAVPAARALGLASSQARRRTFERLILLCTCVLGVAAVAAAAREPVQTAAGSELIRHTAAAAGNEPVLADPINAEQLVLAGQKIWIGDPLDAFSSRTQRAYLDWLDGRARGDTLLTGRGCAVLVTIEGAAQRRLARSPAFHELDRDAKAVLYRRNACLAPA
ncbi:MAG: hypothetical protein QOH23_296 [Gaiellaceae bacterium]|jgi:hypothetical protein|nr:hypothetical protein [Gaiellaceae bacterium]